MSPGYDLLEPPTFDAADDDESYDANEYESYGQDDSADGDDDYDPSSFSIGDGHGQDQQKEIGLTENVQLSPGLEHTQRSQTKVAGFIVDASDDEEQDGNAPSPSQLNGSVGAQSGLGTVAVSGAQDISLSSAPQDAAATSTSLNGSTTVPVPAIPSSSVPDLSLQPSAPEQGKAVTTVVSAQASAASTPQPAANGMSLPPQHIMQANGTTAQPPLRLPHDKVGQLEDRINDDPKGDTSAWLSLIEHYYDKGQYDYAREVYSRFFKVFPTAVSMWIKYVQMENELDEGDRVVHILNESLTKLPCVELWKAYLDHVRRAHPLINDPNGTKRGEITSAFEVTLDHVGIDPDAGLLWREYIDFIKDGPGTIGGTSWQDLQKADLLRKAYQRGIKLPHSESIRLWKEYEAFEMGGNKTTGRKHIQEQSPHYVEARKAKVQLDQKLQGLDRRSLPQLPPIYDCAGEEEFGTQVEKWIGWIDWEKDDDPLVYKGVEDDAYRKRVLYAYKQATMALCFYPRIWFDAASWCFAQGTEALTAEGEQLLDRGIAANPESILLSMTKAERVESNLESGNTTEILIRNGEKLDVPYEEVHTALYALRARMQGKDKKTVQQIQERYASLPQDEEIMQVQDDDAEDSLKENKPKTKEEQMNADISAAKAASAAQLELLKRTISYVWVAKMRAFRRVQGQGQPQKRGDGSKQVVKGFRGIFADARPRGPLSSDVYVASALMEWHCYKDASANKIFDRGMKLFPNDEGFILEYIKHLAAQGDVTNARVVFESTIPKIINAAEFTEEQKQDKCRPLFEFMHDYESKYGDLPQITKIEKRMAELYPGEPKSYRFSHRFALPTFDAMNVQLLLSPTQAQPRSDIPEIVTPQHPATSIEPPRSPAGPEILLGPNGPYIASPKRPLDDSDAETSQRKFMRGESPLKGAAGMRMQAKTAAGGMIPGSGGFATKTFVPMAMQAPIGPTPLPPAISSMLGILPSASSYTQTRFDPQKLVGFLPTVNVEHARAMFNAGQLVRTQ